MFGFKKKHREPTTEDAITEKVISLIEKYGCTDENTTSPHSAFIICSWKYNNINVTLHDFVSENYEFVAYLSINGNGIKLDEMNDEKISKVLYKHYLLKIDRDYARFKMIDRENKDKALKSIINIE